MLHLPVEQIVDEALLDKSCIEKLTTITIEYLVNVFCCDGEGDELNPKDFKAEMEAWGLAKLDAGKLFMFLRNASNKPFDEWQQAHCCLLQELSELDTVLMHYLITVV